MSCCPCCQKSSDPAAPPRRRRGGIVGLLVQLLVVYAVLLFGSGTMINTGHPVAGELGRLIRTVTFVEPTIYWAQDRGFQTVATGLRVLSNGYPMESA